MEPIAIENVFAFEWPNFSPMDWPIKIKLSTLKTVPSTKPLPIDFWPIRIKRSPTMMDRVSARVMYFFWTCLTVSIC